MSTAEAYRNPPKILEYIVVVIVVVVVVVVVVIVAVITCVVCLTTTQEASRKITEAKANKPTGAHHDDSEAFESLGAS